MSMLEDELNGQTEIPVEEGSQDIQDYDMLLENLIYDMAATMSDDERKYFMESDTFQNVVNEGGISKRTVVRMNKLDDLTRRIAVAAFQMAKQDNDPNYKALKKLIAKKQAIKAKILKKYATRVKPAVMKAQKQGFWCGIAFVIQMNGIEEVLPNTETHPEFGEVLSQAKQAGVHVLNLTCSVDKNSLEIISPIRIP